MRRGALIALPGATASWPLVARAQQARTRMIGREDGLIE